MKFKQLFLILVVSCVLFSGIMIFALISQTNAINEYKEMREQQATYQQLGQDVADASAYLTDQARMYAVTGEKEYYNNYWREVEETQRRENAVRQLEEMGATQEELDLLQLSADNSAELVATEEAAMKAVEQGNMDTAIGLMFSDEYEEYVASIMGPVEEFQDLMSSRVLDETQQAENYANTMMTLVLLSTALLIGAILVSFYIIFHRIVRRLPKLIHVAEQISEGDLTVQQLDAKGKDEISLLSKSMNKMSESLRDMVERISQISHTVSRQSEELTKSADEVSSGAEQVASTMEQLSSGAEEQANSSGEISNLITELNQQIFKSNEDGTALEHSSQEVYQMSNQGKEEMGQSVELMNEITTMVTESTEKVKGLDQRSEEISKLIVVIEDIAEQTNLLALNAAIEAARAGESGRGFAVVADEVRKLAEQVGESVTEITQIIGGIQKETKSMVSSLETGYQRVEDGNRQIHISRDSFDSINQAVSDMIGRIQNVSSSLNEISTNADKVSHSVTDIASASEEAAAGIEQSSATAQQQSSAMQEIAGNTKSLSKLSDELYDMIKKFKL